MLVTGASKGIGAACVHRLARDGYRVYAGVRRDEDGEVLRRSVGGDVVVPILLDVTNPPQVADAAARMAEETGEDGLYGVVNNAGVAIAGPLEYLPIDELRRQMEINFIGQLAVTQACLPLLRHASRPRIIFMSSISGLTALPMTGAYAASKFALEAAADALRVELKPWHIGVSLVEPGVIATPIWDTALQAGERNVARMPPEAVERYGNELDAMRKRAAQGMSGLPPEKVADLVARILRARRPRARYLIGKDARGRLLAHRVLPTSVEDWIIRKVLDRL